MKKLLAFTFLASLVTLTASPTYALDLKSWKTWRRIGEGAYIVAKSVDISTSVGKWETNPVLGRGEFGARQVGTTLAITTGIIVAAEVIGNKYPKLDKVVTFGLWGNAGLIGWQGYRNAQVERIRK